MVFKVSKRKKHQPVFLFPCVQNLSRDMPFEDVKYPSDTAIKNRYPDVLPGKHSNCQSHFVIGSRIAYVLISMNLYFLR